MSKKNHMDPQKVKTIINDYLHALRLARGDYVADQTDLSYGKGWFKLRRAGLNPDAIGARHRPDEIEAMTTELRQQIPPRGDSIQNGEPD